MNITKKKVLIFLAIITVTLVAGITVWLVIKYSRGSVVVNLAPEDAKFKLNEKTYTSPYNKIDLKSGSYNTVLTRDGFKSQNLTLKVDGNKTNEYSVILEPSGSNFSNLSMDNREQAAVDTLTELQGQDFLRKNPLTQYLPYYTDNFTIDYDASSNPIVVQIVISTGPQAKEKSQAEAIAWIKSKGVNPNNLKIEYSYLEAAPNE